MTLRAGDVLLLGDIDRPIRLRVELRGDPAPQWQHTVVASRSYPETRQISERLSGDQTAVRVLLHLLEEIGAPTAREQILTHVARAALDAIPGALDSLVIAQDGRDKILTVLAEAHGARGTCREPNSKICDRILKGKEAALLFGQHDTAALPAATLVSQGIGSGIAAALAKDRQVFGVLQINCAPGTLELGESHLDLAVVLAHHAALAIERTDLIARLQAAELRLREENILLRRRAQPEIEMVAESPIMIKTREELRHAAASDVTVLLQGETGTGKEVAARFLHAQSRRHEGLLVPVNCGALTESLLDSELFGHRKGAFTGASADRKGVFEVAAGGTVFLDEIGETPPSLQVRLLRVLEESTIKPVGEAVEKKVDVRIVAATNRDLTRLVQEGRFRQDLYYRLRVFPITLPPLRERREDIEPLCRLFLRRYSQQLGKRMGEIDPSMLAALQRYAFPGNVRELANELERAVVRADEGETLTAEILSEEILQTIPSPPAPSSGGTLVEQLARFEAEIIAATLARCQGRKIVAAKELGLTRQGLAKKMERLGLH